MRKDSGLLSAGPFWYFDKLLRQINCPKDAEFVRVRPTPKLCTSDPKHICLTTFYFTQKTRFLYGRKNPRHSLDFKICCFNNIFGSIILTTLTSLHFAASTPGPMANCEHQAQYLDLSCPGGSKLYVAIYMAIYGHMWSYIVIYGDI